MAEKERTLKKAEIAAKIRGDNGDQDSKILAEVPEDDGSSI